MRLPGFPPNVSAHWPNSRESSGACLSKSKGRRVYAIADEDLERENGEKTAAVHFLRFELAPQMALALKSGAQMKIGCDHPEYLAQKNELEPEVLASLVSDLA